MTPPVTRIYGGDGLEPQRVEVTVPVSLHDDPHTGRPHHTAALVVTADKTTGDITARITTWRPR